MKDQLYVKSNKNILPIAIINSYKAFEESKRLKKTYVKVNIGEEINWRKMEYKNTKDICDYTKVVIEKLMLFLDNDYKEKKD